MQKEIHKEFKKFNQVKSERGSITVFVLAAMLFLLMVVLITYVGISNKKQVQIAQIDKIKEEYESSLKDIDDIYKQEEGKYKVDITVSENGGDYFVAKGGTADLTANISINPKENINVVKREYGWSTSKEEEPNTYESFNGNQIAISKNGLNEGECYLWVKVTTQEGAEIIQVSEAFKVEEQEIIIRPSEEELNKGPIQVTIDYQTAYVNNKKVGIGATLEEAKQNAVANENTNLEISENCYIYVTAEDAYGNRGESSYQINNIDNQKPIVTLSPNGGTFKTEEPTMTIDVTINVKDDQSGVEEVKYAWSDSNTEKPSAEEYQTVENGTTIPSPELGEGKHYLWVIATDKVGNVTEEPSFEYNVVPPAAPTVSLKENDATGAEYVSETWTNQDVYHEITLPEEEGKVEKYQYSLDGQVWKDYIKDENEIKISYTTTFPVAEDNKSSYIGDLTNNGEYYFIPDGEGAIKPTNGDNQGLHSKTANSYIKIDLTTLPSDKSYKLTLNAEVSSESNYDYGYATITESTTAPAHNSETGRFIYISGSKSAQDYSTVLIGGKEYYLHLGYRKDGSGDNNSDTFKVNSLSLENYATESYETTFPMIKNSMPIWLGDLTNNGEHYFIPDGNGAIKPTNGDKQGLHNTTANSYIKLDLSEYTTNDKLNITINAQVSSQSSDYGYATITESTTAPAYNSSTGRIFRISGSSNSPQDYSTTLTGGKVYYLHFGYYKNGSTDSYDDTFKINKITFSSDTMIKYANFYDCVLEGNKLTYTLKEDINREFYVKAIYEDGKSSGITRFKVQIDKTAPVINGYEVVMTSKTDGKLVISDVKEEGSGVAGYYISTSEEAPTKDSNWEEVTEIPFEINNLTAGNTYYVWVIDKVGNISEVLQQEVTEANYKIDTNKYSVTLEQALALAKENSTIELLNDYTDSSIATIDKSIKLDTKQYTLTRTVTTNVKGTTDAPITLDFYGKITNSGNIVTLTTSGTVNLKGTGTIENVATSSSYRPISNSGTLTQDGNITVSGYYYGIYNTGTYTLNSGKAVSNYTSAGYAIYNYSSGDIVNINGGEVVGYSGIYNNSSSTTNINGGRVEGTNGSGINQSRGNVTVNDGEIIGKSSGIYISGSGTTNVIGGKVEGNYGIETYSSSAIVNVTGGIVVGSTYGIYGYTTATEGNEKITIGDINTEVNEKQPIVSGGQYGVYMYRNTYSYNFYNGVIMGTNAIPYTDIIKQRESYVVYTYYNYDLRKYCAVLTQTVEDITITQYPTEWTNQDVEVTIKYPSVEGAINQYSENGTDWVDVENVARINVSENKTIYARMIDSQGILIEPGVVEHKVENIDKIAPEVVVNTDKTKYTILEENEKVDITYSISASDEGGSGLKEAKYAFTQGNEEPQEYQDITNGLQMTENLGKGTYYLWLKVTDNAGNMSDITKMRFMVDLKEPVAQIGDTVYETIQDAFDAAGQTPSTVIILKDTDEVATLLEGQTVTLDLQGHTVGNSKDEAVITNNGTLTIIDTSSEKTGTIDNLVGTGIENNGTLTIGDNSNAIEDAVPTIKGNKVGIQNNSTLNYYDGTIIGKSAISGEVQGTPENYGPVGVYENGLTTVNLRVVSDYVARIDWFYYTTLQSAFDACPAKENNTEQTTVHMLNDIVLENTANVYYGQNIRLNLNSFILTIVESTVMDNYGVIEVTDLDEEENGTIKSGRYCIRNIKGVLKVTGGNVEVDNISNYSEKWSAIYNDSGNIEILNGNISTNKVIYGIYNKGKVEVNGGNIKSYMNSQTDIYGIYNEPEGKIEINGGYISSKSGRVGYGVYNKGHGLVEITGGDISADGGYYFPAYGVYNESNGIIDIRGGNINNDKDTSQTRFYGIYNKIDGKIKMSGGNININQQQESCYGIYNQGNGTVEVNEGNINISCYYNNAVYGIYNESEGIIKINGGSINSSSSKIYTDQYGIYNESNGYVEIRSGTIRVSTNITSGSTYPSNLCGVYNASTGNVVIGIMQEETTKLEEPIIVGEYLATVPVSNSGIGIYNSSEGITKFYAGVIKGTGRWNVGGITAIKEGYEIKEEDTNGYNCAYLIEENKDKYVSKIESTGTQYKTLQEALENIKENEKETITILNDFDLNYGQVVIGENKDVVLNLNGKTITNSKVKIENKGNLEIIDTIGNGEIISTSTQIGIVNSEHGNLKINNANISNNSFIADIECYGIYSTSDGIIEILGGNLVNKAIENSQGSYGIYNNNGTVKINGGIINSSNTGERASNYGIYNESEGKVEVSTGSINSTTEFSSGYGISNKGILKITGGDINTKKLQYSSHAYQDYGISNKGTLQILGGNITCDSKWGCYTIYNAGTLEMSGGKIFGKTYRGKAYGIYNSNNGIITNGVIDAVGTSDYNAYGIYNLNTGIITLGTKDDGIVNTDTPTITGKAAEDGYGIYNVSGIFYFYDGRIEGSTAALTDTTKITEIEENTIQKYENEDKILTLATEEIDLAQVGDITYSNLQEAIYEAGTIETTIKLLRGVRYTNQDLSITIAKDQKIILDLNGKTIVSAYNTPTFINNGEFEILDTSEEKNGRITTSEVDVTIQNNQDAILTITEGNIANTKTSQSTINNEGILNINGGNVSGVTNISILNVNGGSIEGILNKGEAYLKINDGTITNTISNQEQARIDMNGGNINTYNTSIYNTSTNIINILAGTIEIRDTSLKNGIDSSAGTINIGKKDGNIDTNSPNIYGRESGIAVSKNCKLNFYDGIIKGSYCAISGNINEIEESSEIVVQQPYYEILTLQKAEPIAKLGTVQYNSIEEAISNISDTGTVTILRNGTEANTVTIPSEKNIIIDLNGYELKMYNKIQNNGTLTITDNSEGATGVLSSYKDSPIYNNGTLTIENGNISGNTYGIYNQSGTVTVTGGKITNNTYGLYSKGGTINVTGGNIQDNQYGTFTYGGTINISQGNFSGNEYGVYNSSGRTNITGITLNGNTNNIYNGGSGTINIPSGNIITTDNTAIENVSSGTLVIGEEGGTPSKESPLIQAEEYAIKNTGSGTIKFYDGIIKGRTGGLQGLYLYKETGYTVKTDYIDGYYCDTLTPSGTVTTVAKIGNVEYSNLQSAINACTSQEETTIQLVNSISTDSTFQIEEGQNVVIDLNGKTITTSTAQTLINNAGTLKIIDTSSLQVGKITNETYNTIENSGTLTLGVDDGTVSTTCPEITGKAKAIINTGTLNFYDGIIKGATALEGTAVSGKPSGYIMVKTREETTGYEVITLSR